MISRTARNRFYKTRSEIWCKLVNTMNALFIISISIISIALSWWMVGKLKTYLLQQNIVDTPNERTLHQGTIPRGGGLVIVLFLIAAASVSMMLFPLKKVVMILLTSICAWSLLSWMDDKIDLSSTSRFCNQILIALFIVFALSPISELILTENMRVQLSGYAYFLTVLWVVWMANLYNFMDGMDGLAASQAIIAGITLSIWFYQADAYAISLLCIVLSSATYGFLLWNWAPAKIFMGDVGSITLGGLFASLAIVGVSYFDMSFISFVILFSVFIFDATITLLRRAINKEKLWLAHRSHFYQRAAQCGFKHQHIVMIMILLMIMMSILASISLINIEKTLLMSAMSLILLLFFAFGVSYYELKKNSE